MRRSASEQKAFEKALIEIFEKHITFNQLLGLSVLQLQSDQLGVDVLRPTELETTAMGAAYLAGLAEGVWGSTNDIAERWALDRRFTPSADATTRDAAHAQWLRAVERSRNWIAN